MPAVGSLGQGLFARATVLRAARVTALVAPTLILINHAACVMDGKLGLRCLLQAVLTTLVPYCVSSYSSARAMMQGK